MHWYGNRGKMHKTVQICCFRQVFCMTAYPCVSASVPLTYVWAFGFVGCILLYRNNHVGSCWIESFGAIWWYLILRWDYWQLNFVTKRNSRKVTRLPKHNELTSWLSFWDLCVHCMDVFWDIWHMMGWIHTKIRFMPWLIPTCAVVKNWMTLIDIGGCSSDIPSYPMYIHLPCRDCVSYHHIVSSH